MDNKAVAVPSKQVLRQQGMTQQHVQTCRLRAYDMGLLVAAAPVAGQELGY
jgi:hypothetical protein